MGKDSLKFTEVLKRGNKKITEDRAKRLSKSAKREYKRIIDKKEEEIDCIDDKLEKMLDLSASNSNMIDNKTKDLDVKSWVQEMVDLELNREALKLEIEVIEEKVGKYF